MEKKSSQLFNVFLKTLGAIVSDQYLNLEAFVDLNFD